MTSRIATSAFALASLAACSAGIQIGKSTSGAATSDAGPITPLNQTGYTPVTAVEPNPCELDLDFGTVPIGVTSSIVVGVANTGAESFELPTGGATGPEFMLLPDSQLVGPHRDALVTVIFEPVDAGTVSSSFTTLTGDVDPSCPAASGTSATLTVKLTGNGVESCLVAQPDQLDFGNTLLNTSTQQSMTLTNNCAAAVTKIIGGVYGEDANLFVALDAPMTLGSGASTKLDITYSPLTHETRSFANLTFLGSSGENAKVYLLGEPLGEALTLAPNPINFGYVPLTATTVGCTTVSNQANVAVSVLGFRAFANEGGAFAVATTDDAIPPNPYTFPSTEAPLTLEGGASGKVCFQFTPPITQPYNGTITLTTNDPSGTNPVLELTGQGGGPQITCTPTRLDFGPIVDGGSSSLSVTCTNTGSAVPATNLIIDPPIASPVVFYALFDTATNPYPAGGLAPGRSAQIDVTYSPTAASDDTGTLSIKSNAGPGQPLTIPLTGSGIF